MLLSQNHVFKRPNGQNVVRRGATKRATTYQNVTSATTGKYVTVNANAGNSNGSEYRVAHTIAPACGGNAEYASANQQCVTAAWFKQTANSVSNAVAGVHRPRQGKTRGLNNLHHTRVRLPRV